MSRKYTTSILFKSDAETLCSLDNAARELGHSRSLFIRDAILQRVADWESNEKALERHFARPAREGLDEQRSA
jgi:hypothetical protein